MAGYGVMLCKEAPFGLDLTQTHFEAEPLKALPDFGYTFFMSLPKGVHIQQETSHSA